MIQNWDKIPGGYITTINSVALDDVLRVYYDVLQIHHEFCDIASDGSFDRYSRIFSQVFYVAKLDAGVVGYSVYCVKPMLTLCGIRKTAVLYSMAVDREHRGQGIGEQLLIISVREMQLNGINKIVLYVGKENIPAQLLYTKLGFVVTGELAGASDGGEPYYRMVLRLPAIPA